MKIGVFNSNIAHVKNYTLECSLSVDCLAVGPGSICQRMFFHVQHVHHNGHWAQCKLTVTLDPSYVQQTTHQHCGRWKNEQQ
jgi:hypothetical protein